MATVPRVRTLRPLYLSSSSLEAKNTALQKNIMDRFDVHRCSGRKKHGIYCTECGQLAKDLQFFVLDSTAVSREKQPNKSPRLGCQHHLVGTGDLVRTVGGDGDRGPMMIHPGRFTFFEPENHGFWSLIFR